MNDHLNLQYITRIYDYEHWLNGEAYYELINNFLKSKINDEDFSLSFIEMFSNIEKNIFPSGGKELQEISMNINNESSNLKHWVSKIELCCKEFKVSNSRIEEQDNLDIQTPLQSAVEKLVLLRILNQS